MYRTAIRFSTDRQQCSIVVRSLVMYEMSLLSQVLDELLDADEAVPAGQEVSVLDEDAVVADHTVRVVGHVPLLAGHDGALDRWPVRQVQGPERRLHLAQHLHSTTQTFLYSL